MTNTHHHLDRKAEITSRWGGFVVLFALASALFLVAPPAHAVDSYIVIDANSDTVITQQNPDQLLHPASLTKLMTLYMTFDALEQGRITLQSTFPISALAQSQEPTKLDLVAGQKIRVEDAILGLVTLSANDAAVVVAEGLGGSEDRFAQLMTRKAHQLGMINTNFRNANGLPDPGQISTARDIAILSRALIHQFPQYYHYFSVREFTYNGVSYENHNHLMSRYEGMDGLKTGFIRASGFNLAASAVRDGRRLIAVVFGGTSATQRDDYLAGLLDEGFHRPGGALIATAAPPPVPGRKPSGLAETSASPATETARLNTAARPDVIGNLAAAAVTGQGDAEGPGDAVPVGKLPPAPPIVPSLLSTISGNHGAWGIQVGAYATRAATEQAIQQAIRRVPQLLKNATVVIMEMPRRNKTLYRARLTGLVAPDARKACKMLAHCQTVPPGTL